MKKQIIVLSSVVVVLAIALGLNRNSNDQFNSHDQSNASADTAGAVSQLTTTLESHKNSSPAPLPNEGGLGASQEGLAPQQQPSAAMSKYIDKLLKSGFTQDPQNPSQFVKTIKDSKGKPQKTVIYLDADEREVKDFDAAYAAELLTRKQSEDPSFEIQGMSDMDDNYGQSTLLTGSFRGHDSDTEVRIAMLYDESMVSPTGFLVCLFDKELNLNLLSPTDFTVKANEEAYGLVDFKNGVYLRAMSVFEGGGGRRVLMADIIRKTSDSFQSAKRIKLNEIKLSDPEKLKHCGPQRVSVSH